MEVDGIVLGCVCFLVIVLVALILRYRYKIQKLFLHYLDHSLGMRTPVSIIQGVQLSKRRVLVLLENHLKHEWAKLDFKIAHQQVFKDK
ncbi:hypothetical protein RvY_08504 [Ramazzottius varieornatus]|uniref:Uncharacterized protein n=1 Tax=Ramazzottius varieornatus TaxID=947166 RepID=A0A1D1VAN1_RAMVA|nr:hypothetical protein RvY_08504 [Ramazzottius varieornatus]